ncbi:hypothetical protein Lfu02_21710 [Longispora fulva]|uniref:non-specific serine/threonine protein kinase n=1 Tax=Longispora fulva TaxID=619741 RepID=A0A8J7KYX9_9ACTN|nr:serine/threonine-protein kinase [Longispora fulva]MBG6139817.1 serine/threonine protein kinase [Longispora fulva]GIG57799.1 hypothetical protein Lfu02_21710 [Longispora fulva]
MTRRPSPPQIPGYRYDRDLGGGGYATVYVYEQLSLNREVAIKVPKDAGTDAAARAQFIAEARTMARLGNHAHIIQVLEQSVSTDGQPYLVMPFCSGPNLAERASGPPIPVAEVLRIGITVSGAVQATHQVGIVHRDIKPANLLTDEFKKILLADFGVAGPVAESEDYEDFGVSVPWSPPEILAGEWGGIRSDVYSLGATLWHLLVGRSPFEIPGGDNSQKALERRIHTGSAPATGRPDVPAALEALLARTMSRTPAARPASARVLESELARIESRLAPTVATPDPGPTTPRTPAHDLTTRRVVTAPGPKPPGVEPGVPTTVDRPDSVRPLPVPPPVGHTQRKPVPEPTVDAPATDRARWPGRWLTGTGVLVLATVGVVVAVVLHGSDTAAPHRVLDESTGQSAGDDTPPGRPTVAVTRSDPAHLRFSWTYSAPQATDTFTWRTPDGARTGIAPKAVLDLDDPAGTELCVQVKVVRADGSHASADWSAAGCAR